MKCWLEDSFHSTLPIAGSFSIGRMPGNDLLLDDPEVSRRHALIHAQSGSAHWLVDLGSRNGVFVNGHRIRQPIQLDDHSHLKIASHTFVFRALRTADDDAAVETLFDRKDQGAHFPAWVLAADIAKFSGLSQTVPTRELAQLVGKWFLAANQIVEQHHGTFTAYRGDGFLAHWPDEPGLGAEVAGTLAALKRLQMAQKVQCCVAVHLGHIKVATRLSNPAEQLTGSTVNFAQRLARLAAEQRQFCLVSTAVAAQIGPALGLAAHGRHVVHGFEGHYPLHTFWPEGGDYVPQTALGMSRTMVAMPQPLTGGETVAAGLFLPVPAMQ